MVSDALLQDPFEIRANGDTQQSDAREVRQSEWGLQPTHTNLR